jgi:hypothetical protein
MSTPFVSVVVATRDRAGLLAQTLDALAGQRWPRDQFEIVVADNGSLPRGRLLQSRGTCTSRNPANPWP